MVHQAGCEAPLGPLMPDSLVTPQGLAVDPEGKFAGDALPTLHRNLHKQLVKRPGVHFLDSDHARCVAGLRSTNDLRHWRTFGDRIDPLTVRPNPQSRLFQGGDGDRNRSGFDCPRWRGT